MKLASRHSTLMIGLLAALFCVAAFADSSKDSIAGLQKQIAALKSDRDDLQDKADRLTADLKDARSDRTNKSKFALAKVERDLKDANADVAEAEATIYEHEHKCDIVIAKREHKKIDPADQAKHDRVLREAYQQKKSADQRVNKLTDQRNDLKDNAPSDDERKIAAALKKAQDQIDSKNQQIHEFEKELADLQKSDRKVPPARPAKSKRPPGLLPPETDPVNPPTTVPATLPTTAPTTAPTPDAAAGSNPAADASIISVRCVYNLSADAGSIKMAAS